MDAHLAQRDRPAIFQQRGLSCLAALGREVKFFPGLLSRYRDFRKPDHKLLGSPEEFEVMLQMVDKLPLRPVGNGIRHVIILTSFNEFFEGTSRL
jgi:hypothetical protein